MYVGKNKMKKLACLLVNKHVPFILKVQQIGEKAFPSPLMINVHIM